MNRTDEEKTIDYANMGSSVTVINNLIAGDSSVIGDMTETRRKEKVKIKDNDGNDNNNQPTQPVVVKKNFGGTEVQTTEAKLAEEKAADDEYDMRKTKRRGRRQTILTSQRGASGNLELGKKSLLGV